MTFNGAKDGKHYWLTPKELYQSLDNEFHFTFDPAPYPRPEGFDGLSIDWGNSNYVNPPFGSVVIDGKKMGPTAWARKAITEYQKGKKVVMVYPIDKWVLMLLEHCTEIRNLYDVKWVAIEDNNSHMGTGRHIAAFIMDPEKVQ